MKFYLLEGEIYTELAKKSVWVFHNILQENLNKLFGQRNIINRVAQISKVQVSSLLFGTNTCPDAHPSPRNALLSQL